MQVFIFYFFLGGCNDPGEGGQERGGGGDGDIEGGNGEGETWMGKRGGVEVLTRAGSEEGETGIGLRPNFIRALFKIFAAPLCK